MWEWELESGGSLDTPRPHGVGLSSVLVHLLSYYLLRINRLYFVKKMKVVYDCNVRCFTSFEKALHLWEKKNILFNIIKRFIF